MRSLAETALQCRMEILTTMDQRNSHSGMRSASRRRGLVLGLFAAMLCWFMASAPAQMVTAPGSPPSLQAPAAGAGLHLHSSQQSPDAAHTKGRSRHKPAVQPAPPPPVEGIRPVPPNLAEKPAVPPNVQWNGGLLSIDATNSDLADVFRAVQRVLGATVEGARPGERVVVHLGPGSPTEVLTALLDGSHYDYILVGKAEQPGSISRIVLATRQAEGAASAHPAPPPAPAQEEEESGEDAATPEPVRPGAPPRNSPRPGVPQAQPPQPLMPGQQPPELPPDSAPQPPQ